MARASKILEVERDIEGTNLYTRISLDTPPLLLLQMLEFCQQTTFLMIISLESAERMTLQLQASMRFYISCGINRGMYYPYENTIMVDQ
jgi:hypothetical protein